MQGFCTFIILFFLSFLLGILMIISSILASPGTKNIQKELPYECGIILHKNSNIQFNIQFLKYAVLFLIFDIETIFIFPCAISFDIFGTFALLELSLFLGVMFLGLIYAIRKRMLKVK